MKKSLATLALTGTLMLAGGTAYAATEPPVTQCGDLTPSGITVGDNAANCPVPTPTITYSEAVRAPWDSYPAPAPPVTETPQETQATPAPAPVPVPAITGSVMEQVQPLLEQPAEQPQEAAPSLAETGLGTTVLAAGAGLLLVGVALTVITRRKA